MQDQKEGTLASTQGPCEAIPHVPVNAGTASWAAEPGWEKGHQPQKTQAGTWTRGHELETKR